MQDEREAAVELLKPARVGERFLAERFRKRARSLATRGTKQIEVLPIERAAIFDASALEQALTDLLQNAVEACSPALPVTVRVGAKDETVTIAISDKGVGMDSDFVRNRLFQPFASSKPSGFGIGAFEARSLVTAMGGRLSVDSQPGRGTTFTIMLPVAEPVSEPERKQA